MLDFVSFEHSDEVRRAASSRYGVAFVRRNALGLLAIFIALTSSAYAITSLPAGSVGTKQLRNGAVTGNKVAKSTLTGANVRAATLGTVPTAEHAKGAATATFVRITGAQGPGATSFGPVSGLAPADVAGDVEQISPNVPITASGLSVRFSAPALNPTLHTNVTLEVNGADSALTCANGIGHQDRLHRPHAHGHDSPRFDAVVQGGQQHVDRRRQHQLNRDRVRPPLSNSAAAEPALSRPSPLFRLTAPIYAGHLSRSLVGR